MDVLTTLVHSSMKRSIILGYCCPIITMADPKGFRMEQGGIRGHTDRKPRLYAGRSHRVHECFRKQAGFEPWP